MTNAFYKISSLNMLHIAAALILAASFFMPWVVWDGAAVKGVDMPLGHFFSTAEKKTGIANPFPGLSFAFYIFLLIPAFSIISIAAVVVKKNSFWTAIIAAALSLSLVIVYYLFTGTVVENGLVTKSSIQPWLVVQLVAAIALALTAGAKKWSLKAGLLILTILGTYFGFKAVSSKLEKDILSEQHQTTDKVKTDFTITADLLIKEFITNDTAANSKYREKIVEVSGIVNTTEIAADSASTLKFADSTGSYAIFSVEKSEINKMKTIKQGDMVTVKGVCSGSIFSEILGTTSINFKRSVIQQKQ